MYIRNLLALSFHHQNFSLSEQDISLHRRNFFVFHNQAAAHSIYFLHTSRITTSTMGSEGKNQSSSRRSRGRDRGNDRGRGSDSRGRGRGANQVEASIDDDGFTMVPESRSRSRSTQRSQSVTRSGALLSEPRGSTQRYRPTGAEHEQYIRGIWFQWNHPVEPPLLARTIKAIEEYLDNPRGDDPNAVMTRARYQPTQAIVAA